MKIKNYDVPQRAIEACESRMRSDRFKAADITKTAMIEGVPEMIDREYVANRVADRLIQKHRKAGKIRMVDRKPTWEFLSNVKSAPTGSDGKAIEPQPESLSPVGAPRLARCSSSDIPDELVLGSISFGDSVLIEYLNPRLAEPERGEVRKSWMEDAERMGGPENLLRRSPLYGAGNLWEAEPATGCESPSGQSECQK